MDYRGGLEWTELDDILKANFKAVLWTMHPNDRQNLERLQSLADSIASLSSLKLLFSGSVVEGSLMDPKLRVEGFEGDVMFSPTNFILDYSRQRDMLKYVPDTPGYVIVEIPNSHDPAHLLRGVTGLKLRENGSNPVRYHVVPRPSIRNEVKSLFELLPKNWNLKELLTFRDSLRIGKMQYELDYSGTAISVALSGVSKYLFDKRKRSGLWREFLHDVADKYLPRPRSADAVQDESSACAHDEHVSDYDDENRAPLLRHMSFDYVRMPEAGREHPLGLKLDLVPAIECIGWPEVALPFFQRKRNWPEVGMLGSLRQDGFHIVHKPLDRSSADSVEWRISFSKAELALFHHMDPFKLHCYRIFKNIYYCELTLPRVLCSYYMKTIFLWTCERLPAEAWVEEHLSQVIMGLLDELLQCLVTKQCPHYFIPECNLFAHAHEEFLLDLTRKVSCIRTEPYRYPTQRTS